MANYTNVLGLYTPTDVTDSFGSTFLPEMAKNMTLLDKMINGIYVEPTGGDDTAEIQKAVNDANGLRWVILRGTYTITGPITGKNVKIMAMDAVINANNAGEALYFKGVSRGTYSTTSAYSRGQDYLLMANTVGIKKGDLIRFYSTTELFHPARSYYYKGADFIVQRVDSDRVYIDGALPYGITSVTNVEVYDPANVIIQGNLRIENTVALPNGTFGLRLEYATNFLIEGLTVDNYDTCISPRFSVNGQFRYCNTERAWYTGSGQSYGFATISSRKIHYENCHTKTGRHGHTGGGWEMIDFISFKNCSFINETESGEISFDLHENAFNIIVENCEMDSFTVIGNVKMYNCTVFHKQRVDSSFRSSDEDWKCNYIFENMTFPNGGKVALTGYSQSGGTWTMNQIGNFVARNWATGDDATSMHLDFKAQDEYAAMPIQNIGSVIFENIINCQLLLKDNIKSLAIRNSTYLLNNVHLYQYSGMVDSLLIETCKLIARYNGVYFTGFKVAKVVSSTTFSVSDSTAGMTLSASGSNITIDTCNLSGLSRGLTSNGTKMVLINSVVTLYSNTVGTTVTV